MTATESEGTDELAASLREIDRALDELAARLAAVDGDPAYGAGNGDGAGTGDGDRAGNGDGVGNVDGAGNGARGGDDAGAGGAVHDDAAIAAAFAAAVAAVDGELTAIATRLEATGADDHLGAARAALLLRRDRLDMLERAVAAWRARAAARTALEVAPVGVPAAVDLARRHGAPHRPAGARATGVGRIMSVVGLVLVGFLLYQLTGSAVVYERNQRVMLERFRAVAPDQAFNPATSEAPSGEDDGLLSSAEASGEMATDGEGTGEPEIVAAPEPPARGEPIGILQIPELDLEEVIVQGTRPSDLRSGPGHLRGTAMPGEPGNAAVAASRLANGGPFRDLNSLEEGDRIEVTTAVGRFRYDVTSVRRVGEGDPDPVRARGGGSTLTLVTSAPAFVAQERLVVVAQLRTKPVAPRFAPVTPDSAETGLDTAPGGLAPVLGWGALLAVACVAARNLYRRHNRAVAYLISTPVLVALLVLVFESLGGLLPATF